MAVQMEIILRRSSKTYYEGETIKGIIHLESNSDYKHEGIVLTMEGTVVLTLSSKNIGLLDAFYNSVKPIQVAYSLVEIASGGCKMPAGVTEIPFEIPITSRPNKSIYETYHGVFIKIQYKLKCEIRRGFLAKDINKEIEFFVKNRRNNIKDSAILAKLDNSSVDFTITPSSCRGINRSERPVPNFHFTGTIDHTVCDIESPFTGMLTIQKGTGVIKSVELQLVRVETCGCAEGFAREETEIQNIQIAEGDVPDDIQIPIYMIFPRLYSCPTLTTANFKIEFELNLVVLFEDTHLISENFPIVIYRKSQ